MGVTFFEFKFLELIKKDITFGKVLTVGRQEIILENHEKKLFGIYDSQLNDQKYIDKILLKQFNSLSVDSIDFSDFEKATIIADLNKPMGEKNLFDTIIDFGTSEHVFDIAQCLQNIANLCKKDGTILHSLPANNNCGHGFWQFSPELFFSLYTRENGFSDTEIFLFNSINKNNIWKIKKQPMGNRLELSSDIPLFLLVKTKKIKEITSQSVNQSDYQFLWNKNVANYGKKKTKISKIWKKIKMSLKKFFLKKLLPKKLGEKIEGKNNLLKKDYLKSIYLDKIKI